MRRYLHYLKAVVGIGATGAVKFAWNDSVKNKTAVADLQLESAAVFYNLAADFSFSAQASARQRSPQALRAACDCCRVSQHQHSDISCWY
jgi:hypothetical protein